MNNISGHPSSLLTQEQVKEIRGYALPAEKLGRLTPEQLKLIYSNNWFNLFVPQSLGGIEIPLPGAIRLEESLAWADGSFGWTVTLCSGANWFVGFLHPEMSAAIFSDPLVCFAGSGAATGKAVKTVDGYIISGSWKYATGAPHATHFTANCIEEINGTLQKDEAGNFKMLTFIFEKNDVHVTNDWDYMGMKATASQSFALENLLVSKKNIFTIDAAHVQLPQPVYQFPFLQFAQLTLTANFSGMAIHFIDICTLLFHEKIKQKSQSADEACEVLECLGRSKTKFDNERDIFFETLDTIWNRGVASGKWSQEDSKIITTVCQSLVQECRAVVNVLYPYCGMIAAQATSELNRVWRDFNTATQHSLFSFSCE